MVTLKVFILLQRLLVGFQTIHRRSRGGLFGQKLFSAFGIPPEGRWAFPLFDLFWQGFLANPGVQGEDKGGADGDGELEVLALTLQCLAEFQALSGQRGELISITAVIFCFYF